MKTAIHTKFAGRRLPSLALLLAAVTLLAFAPPSAHAGFSMPFHASFITEFESTLSTPSLLYLKVTGRGSASPMGATTTISTDEVVSLIDGSATATYTVSGAHGDTLILAMVFQATNVSGGVTFAGSYTVTGGTGRYSAATGSGVLAGSALFLTENEGIGSFSISGVISPFGY